MALGVTVLASCAAPTGISIIRSAGTQTLSFCVPGRPCPYPVRLRYCVRCAVATAVSKRAIIAVEMS